MSRAVACITLLIASNLFMTTAWYYHLRLKSWPLWLAIMVSWLIALPEYWLQVPANRLGHIGFGGVFTAPQLKVLQEAITLMVFTAFTHLVLKEGLRWNDVVAFAFIFAGVAISALGQKG